MDFLRFGYSFISSVNPNNSARGLPLSVFRFETFPTDRGVFARVLQSSMTKCCQPINKNLKKSRVAIRMDIRIAIHITRRWNTGQWPCRHLVYTSAPASYPVNPLSIKCSISSGTVFSPYRYTRTIVAVCRSNKLKKTKKINIYK